jgi:hypothetical protein
LLALRALSLESGMFHSMEGKQLSRGRFHQLFTDRDRLLRYLCCILIGIPIWFVIGILITFAPELSKALGVEGTITGSKAIMWSYAGLSLGDLTSGLVSQWIKSRKKAVLLYLSLTLAMILIYVTQRGWSETAFYLLCSGLGFATGYWAVFVTIGAEQFGTNIRATVATTVPNFVRGSVVPVTLSFAALREPLGVVNAALTVGVGVVALAFLALFFLKETFGKNLDYFETL